MAEVHTPYELRLSWNPVGSMPAVATAVHGTYQVNGSGPTYDVFYTTLVDGVRSTKKLASSLSGGVAYDLCTEHNKKTLAIIGYDQALGRAKRNQSRNERPCADCGTIHAGECW
jgi:hypothetical protein